MLVVLVVLVLHCWYWWLCWWWCKLETAEPEDCIHGHRCHLHLHLSLSDLQWSFWNLFHGHRCHLHLQPKVISLSLSSSSTVFLNPFFPTEFFNYRISPIQYFTNTVFLKYCISQILYFLNTVFQCHNFIFISLSNLILTKA